MTTLEKVAETIYLELDRQSVNGGGYLGTYKKDEATVIDGEFNLEKVAQAVLAALPQ